MKSKRSSTIRFGGWVLVAIALTTFTLSTAEAKPSAGEWSTLFTAAEAGGVAGEVRESVIFDGDLIIGGRITTVAGGDLVVNNLAGFDGHDWFRFGGARYGDPYTTVTALAEFDGDLIMGGRFLDAGGVAATNIARYDGEDWHAMGDGLGDVLDDIVMDLFVYEGELYAGGRFAFSGATAINNVARWDGTSWQPCGWSFGGVMAFAEYNGRLVAAGDPIYVNFEYRAWIAGWDGSTWLNHGYLPGYVTSLCTVEDVSGETLFAGGLLSGMASPVYLDGVWRTFQGGVTFQDFAIPPVVSSLSSIKGNLVVGGWFDHAGTAEAWGVATWNGKWTSLDYGTHAWDVSFGEVPGHVYTLLPDDQTGEIYVGGEFTTVGDGSIKSPGLALFLTKTRPGPPSGGAAAAGIDLTRTRNLVAAPNPFGSGTAITFRLDEPGSVRLRIFDVRGRCVSELLNQEKDAGEHTLRWSGRDDAGLVVTSGVYFAVVETPAGRETQKLMMVK